LGINPTNFCKCHFKHFKKPFLTRRLHKTVTSKKEVFLNTDISVLLSSDKMTNEKEQTKPEKSHKRGDRVHIYQTICTYVCT